MVSSDIQGIFNRHAINVNCDLQYYEPPFTPGESYQDALNGDLIDLTDFADFRLGIFSDRNVLLNDSAILQTYDVDGSLGRIAWSIPSFPAIPDGRVRLGLFNTVTNDLLYISNNWFIVTNDQRFLINETAFFEYSNSAEIYNYPYTQIPDFAVQVRLNISKINTEYVFTIAGFKEVSTGFQQNVRSDIDKAITVETENFDEFAHQSFAIFLAHNTKTINGFTYVVQADASYATENRDKNSLLWTNNIVLVQQDFSTINKQ